MSFMASTMLSFSPKQLFRAGEKGVWYDPSDMSTLWQDSARTTAVTAVEQPVGCIDDKSGNGFNATQSTSASRPVLSARVNFIRNSTTPWAQTSSGSANITFTNTGTYGPDGSTLSYKAVLSTTGSASYAYSNADLTVPAGSIVKFTQRVKTTTSDYQYALLKGLLGTSDRYAVLFNVSTGAMVSEHTAGSPANKSYAATQLTDGWWEFSIQFSSASSGTPQWGCLPSPVSNPSLDMYLDITTRGDGTKAIYLAGADLRVSNDGVGLPAYQRVNTSTDYDVAGFSYYLRFDGTDDSLATGSINPGSVDKAQVFAGVRKLSLNWIQCIVEQSSGGTGTGSFNHFATAGTAKSIFGLCGTDASGYDLGGTDAILTTVNSCRYDLAGTDRSTEIFPRVNGVIPVLTGTNSSTAGSANFGNYPLYIGGRSGIDFYFNGRIYGLIVRFSANSLDTAQMADTEGWMNSRTRAY